jgi:hypothetical protein
MNAIEPDELIQDGAGRSSDRGGASVDYERVSVFEDRYGVGAREQLRDLFAQPCVTFAEIAVRFGVTRERVRQWHLLLEPTAPRGHRRQRLCRVYRQKKRLLEDPLFRSFYRHVRPHLPPRRIHLMGARDGFRTRAVRLDDRTVAIRRAAPLRHVDGPAAFRLHKYAGSADLIYYSLEGEGYLFLPRTELPAGGTIFFDVPTSKYRRFKNTFQALGSSDAAAPFTSQNVAIPVPLDSEIGTP